jgi:exodeoxyribonuclease-5
MAPRESSPVITFGKYRGALLSEIATDESYLRWMLGVSGLGRVADFVAGHKDAILAILNAKSDAMMQAAGPVTVTPHQQEAVDKLLSQIDAGYNVVRLSGGAGYGKSYTVLKLLTELRKRGLQCRACATSYVATQVLAQQLEPYGFECATVARTVKLQKVFQDGVEDYILTPDSYEAAAKILSPGNVLVVDEGSMVADLIGEMLIEAARTRGGLLILVGDEFQLPPVKQETLSICSTTPDDAATLTEPMRYSRDSHLFQLEQQARHNPHTLTESLVQLTSNEQVTKVASAYDLVSSFVGNFYADPGKSHRLLAFRRAEVVDFNNVIRRSLYGVFSDDVEPGEQIMILRTSDYPYVEKAEVGDVTRYYSGQTFTVVEAAYSDYQGIPCWLLRFQGRRDPVRVVFAVSESQMDPTKRGGPEYAEALATAYRNCKDTKDWKEYKRLQNDFVSIAYCYATSVHRAQGQTVDYCYTSPLPLLGVKGRLGRALAYVALTRARERVTVRV